MGVPWKPLATSPTWWAYLRSRKRVYHNRFAVSNEIAQPQTFGLSQRWKVGQDAVKMTKFRGNGLALFPLFSLVMQRKRHPETKDLHC